jgi:uncharacterized membrane protein YhhN
MKVDGTTWAIFAVAAVLLGGLLWTSRGKSTFAVLATKTPLSLLFLLTAVRAPHPAPTFAACMTAGLSLSVVGDVLLALTAAWAFRAGLVAFLLGHVAYVVAFATLGAPGLAAAPGFVVALAVSAGVFRWLRPHLGAMLVPVFAYVVVITLMVAMAGSVLVTPSLSGPFRATVFVGAVLFYLSDITVARQRFVADELRNRVVGLPLYYVGQFVLALTVGLAPAS